MGQWLCDACQYHSSARTCCVLKVGRDNLISNVGSRISRDVALASSSDEACFVNTIYLSTHIQLKTIPFNISFSFVYHRAYLRLFKQLQFWLKKILTHLFLTSRLLLFIHAFSNINYLDQRPLKKKKWYILIRTGHCQFITITSIWIVGVHLHVKNPLHRLLCSLFRPWNIFKTIPF